MQRKRAGERSAGSLPLRRLESAQKTTWLYLIALKPPDRLPNL
jgi:hypothetical protein